MMNITIIYLTMAYFVLTYNDAKNNNEIVDLLLFA